MPTTDYMEQYLKSEGIPTNSARADTLRGSWEKSGRPWIGSYDNMHTEMINRHPELNKNNRLGKWFAKNMSSLLSPAGFFTHSANPAEPDSVHVSKGNPYLALEELLHADQFQHLNPSQKDSLVQVNLNELHKHGMLDQYSIPGTVESIHAVKGPAEHSRYKDAIKADFPGLKGLLKAAWYDFTRPHKKLNTPPESKTVTKESYERRAHDWPIYSGSNKKYK